jgi:NAD(P)-dependent dehydrogenase (short-subunit alcohol dehydrogenase family)
MQDRVAVITGGTTGIGRSTAVAFAKRGVHTVFCGRRRPEGEQTLKLVQAEGVRGMFVQADVCDEPAMKSMVEQTVSEFGRIDYAFNNAGITGPLMPTVAFEREVFEAIIATNVTGTWLCMKYQIPAMLKQGSGAIVNMSSVSGVWGTPGLSPYVAAKHAVLGLTKTAAMEYAQTGVRINAVGPAGIMTEVLTTALGGDEVMTAKFKSAHHMNRFGDPDEVAKAVVWLCSDEASYITGHTLMIDGGAVAGVNPFR